MFLFNGLIMGAKIMEHIIIDMMPIAILDCGHRINLAKYPISIFPDIGDTLPSCPECDKIEAAQQKWLDEQEEMYRQYNEDPGPWEEFWD